MCFRKVFQAEKEDRDMYVIRQHPTITFGYEDEDIVCAPSDRG